LSRRDRTPPTAADYDRYVRTWSRGTRSLPAPPRHAGLACQRRHCRPGCEASITGDGNTAASLGDRRCPAPTPFAKVVRLAPENLGLDFRAFLDRLHVKASGVQAGHATFGSSRGGSCDVALTWQHARSTSEWVLTWASTAPKARKSSGVSTFALSGPLAAKASGAQPGHPHFGPLMRGFFDVALTRQHARSTSESVLTWASTGPKARKSRPTTGPKI
jgi:hypothetical protein